LIEVATLKNEGFYVATAQVIPLMFIAAAIEARYFSDKALTGFWYGPIGDAVYRMGAIVAMVWGEAESLATLARGYATDKTVVALVFAYMLGTFFVVGPFFRYQVDAISKESAKSVGENWGSLIGCCVPLVFFGFLILLYAFS
jgi:hypothetical protein